MSACEQCWTQASHRALMGQGMTADLYVEELRQHPEHAEQRPQRVEWP